MNRLQEVQEMAKMNRDNDFPAIFVGKTIPHIVQERSKWKVNNIYCPSKEDPRMCNYFEESYPSDKPPTELEKLYKEFCEKAHRYLRGHISFNGENHGRQIVFPDFTYDVIERKFPVK